jgi:hypothetical protein
MNSKQFLESTTSGAIASVSQPLGSVHRRKNIGKGVYPNQKSGSLFTGKKTKKKFSNTVKETEDYVAPEITWDSLDEGLSVKDKISIIEEYALTGSLTESVEQDTKDYFISLASMSDDPEKNKEYIVVPLALLSNGVRILNEPTIMEFIRYDNDGMIFRYEGIEKTYPSKTIREKSVFYTSTFATKESYDKFRMIMILKFDTKLPEVNIHIKENKGNTIMKDNQKRSIGEASFTAVASMHAATRKKAPQKADSKHGIKVGDHVDTTDGKSGKVSFVDGETVHVPGTNPYYPDKVKHYKASELKKSVSESKDPVWNKGTPMPKDYTCSCGIHVHPSVSKPNAIHTKDCPYAKKKGVSEAKLDEEDIVIRPGQGNRIKPGFIPRDKARGKGVYPNEKGGNLLTGKKTNKKYANSVNESTHKHSNMDQWLDHAERSGYKVVKGQGGWDAHAVDKNNQEMGTFSVDWGSQAHGKGYLKSKQPKTLDEAKLDEEDVIIVPGQGNRIKPGFIPRDKDRTDHEVEMAKSDLFQSAKNAKHVYELIKDIPETVGIEGWVQEKIIKASDYLNTVREYLEHKQNDYRAMAEGEKTQVKDRKTGKMYDPDAEFNERLDEIVGGQIEPQFSVKSNKGVYKYSTEIDDGDPDVNKIWHILTLPDGTTKTINFTPYSIMSKQDLINYLKLGMPDKAGNTTLDSEWLSGMAQQMVQEGKSIGSNDYFRRRQREEDIISGKKSPRKKALTQTSDYATRREQEKKKDVSESIKPKHIVGGLALVAALMGADHLTSAKQTPLGKALAAAAQQGDQDAARYLTNLDHLVDTKQSALVTKLANKYLHKTTQDKTQTDTSGIKRESSIIKGLKEAKK